MRRIGGRAKMLRTLRDYKGLVKQAFLDFAGENAKKISEDFFEHLVQNGLTPEDIAQIKANALSFVSREIQPVLLDLMKVVYKRFLREIEKREEPPEYSYYTQQVTAYIGENTASLAVNLSDSQIHAIRQILERVATGELTPYMGRRLLMLEIELTPREAGAVTRMALALMEEGLSPERVLVSVTKYAYELLELRAERIERTELSKAYNYASHKFVEEGMMQGYIEGVERVWETAGDSRVCLVCAGNDGAKAAMGQPFPSGHVMPPAHPNCRCTVVFEIKEV